MKTKALVSIWRLIAALRQKITPKVEQMLEVQDVNFLFSDNKKVESQLMVWFSQSKINAKI